MASRIDVGAAIATYAALYGQRIGQFIVNITPINPANGFADPFYIEDDELLELAQEYMLKHPPQIRER